MKTRFLATALCVLGVSLVAAPGCSASNASAVGVGDPCTPGVEADGTFLGFSENEVKVPWRHPAYFLVSRTEILDDQLLL